MSIRTSSQWAFSAPSALALALVCAGCFANPANVRTFAGAVQTMTGDASGVVAADQSSCNQNAALQKEYAHLEHQELGAPPCEDLAEVLKAILAENKALEAYAKALSQMAQDQFVTSDTDAKAVTTTLKTSKLVAAPVAEAVGSIFSLVEKAALEGYRQKELSKVMTGEPAEAFKLIIGSYRQLADQYAGGLEHQLSNVRLIENVIRRNHEKTEPVAVAEMSMRLDATQLDIQARIVAIKAFTDAVGMANAAFDAAMQDLTNPNPKELYESVKSFTTQAKDAHDKCKKAFGVP